MEGAHATDEDAPDIEPADTPSGAGEVAKSSAWAGAWSGGGQLLSMRGA